MSARFGVYLICLFSLVPMALATEKEVEIEGSDVAALCYAMKKFAKDYPHADLKHFSVYVEVSEDSSQAQIAFVPLPEPRKPGELVLNVGGSNKFGEEVHYVMSRKPLKVVRKFYGK